MPIQARLNRIYVHITTAIRTGVSSPAIDLVVSFGSFRAWATGMRVPENVGPLNFSAPRTPLVARLEETPRQPFGNGLTAYFDLDVWSQGVDWNNPSGQHPLMLDSSDLSLRLGGKGSWLPRSVVVVHEITLNESSDHRLIPKRVLTVAIPNWPSTMWLSSTATRGPRQRGLLDVHRATLPA